MIPLPAVESKAPTAPAARRPARRLLAEPGSYPGTGTRFTNPRSGHLQTTATLTGRHRHRADRPPRNLTREPSRGPSSGHTGQLTSLLPDRPASLRVLALVKFLHSQRCRPEHRLP